MIKISYIIENSDEIFKKATIQDLLFEELC